MKQKKEYRAFVRYLANVGSVSSLANLLGRVFWGTACDRFGWALALVSLSVAQTVLIATFSAVASLKSESMFAIWTSLILFNYGG